MAISTATKWGLGLGLLALGGLALASSTASGAPTTGSGGLQGKKGTRHGIAYDGCTHFELNDMAAIQKWGEDNKTSFLGWALKLDEIREDPEPLLIDLMSTLFPECSWPPPSSTTFGPDREPWSKAVASAKATLAQLTAASPLAPGQPPPRAEVDMLIQAVFWNIGAHTSRARRPTRTPGDHRRARQNAQMTAAKQAATGARTAAAARRQTIRNPAI